MKRILIGVGLLLILSAAILVSTSTSVAPHCEGSGNIHMIEPASTVYCTEHGHIIWAVTYSFTEKLIIVQDARKTRFWSFPMRQNSTTHDRQDITHDDTVSVLEFTTAFGTITEDRWLPVAITGNP